MAKKLNINDRKLNQLRMLADWQLRNMGYDPIAVTLECLKRFG